MPKIIGHRGAAGYAPENTLSSFQAAIDTKCDRTELDVRLSKDKKVVVFHDEEVSRVTNGQGLVKDLSLRKLKELNLFENQKIPTLKEVIDLCKDKIDLQIELKAPGTPLQVNQILIENDFENNAVIMSFDVNLLKEIKQINPKLKIGLLFNKYSKRLWTLIKKIPLDFIGPKGSIVTEEIVKKAHELGKTVYAYHVDNKKLGDKLRALGVDEIGTDFPRLFV